MSDVDEAQRRNPKRKAAENIQKTFDAPEYLIEEALRPLTSEERSSWPGWIEVESDPSFFSIILRDLGITGVRTQEVFTLDADSLELFTKPVFGLVFLFECTDSYEIINESTDCDQVWFANQTVENACATVALLNIVMNQEIELGDDIQRFRDETMNLSPPLRGYQLSKNTFIRSIHNSFATRMDQLNADLCLENEDSASKSKKAKRRPARTSSRRGQNAFHFIAYVPSGGCVYELDGLADKPLNLGDVKDKNDWTIIARPQIEARMVQYQESQLSFNLLALCRSPLTKYSQNIAQGLCDLRFLNKSLENSHPNVLEILTEDHHINLQNDDLAEFQLREQDISACSVTEQLQSRLKESESSPEALYNLRIETSNSVKSAMGEYRAETLSTADDEQRVLNRKKDYGSAIHKWVSKLAEKGVLEDIIKAV